MIRIRRIFWKVFFAFWLTNLFILLAMAYVVISKLGSVAVRERQIAIIDVISARIVEQYEQAKLPELTVESESFSTLRPIYREIFDSVPLAIYNSDNTLIFQSPVTLSDTTGRNETFSVISQSGNRYHVYSKTGVPPRFVIKELRRLNSLQMLFILLGSMGVSLILSWSIARPLKQLGAYSRNYANGDTQLAIQETLLRRGDEVGDLARDFDFMRKQVEKNISSQKQLLHDVSHELRAPLARLQATAGLLQKKHKGDQEYVDRIDRECDRINALIQQILDFSRLEHSETEPSVVDLIALIKSEIEDIAFEYSDIHIVLDVQSQDILLNTYPDVLSRAFNNILANACKYSESGANVEVTVGTNENQVSIAIRDHGPGIPDDEIKQVQQPFYRVGKRMHGEGYGLGLSIVRRAVEICRGRFVLYNHREGGLVSTIYLSREGLLASSSPT